MNSFCILDTNSLSGRWFCQYFLPAPVGSFVFCWPFLLLCRSLFIWCSPTCLFLGLLLMPLVSYPNSHCWGQCQVTFLPMFSTKNFTVEALHLIFHLFWANFCKWCKGADQFHSFACECPVSQNHLWKRLSFTHWVFLAPLSSISWLYMPEFVSGLSILFHLSYACK